MYIVDIGTMIDCYLKALIRCCWIGKDEKCTLDKLIEGSAIFNTKTGSKISTQTLFLM